MLIQRSVRWYPARHAQKLFRALMLLSPAVASPHTLITRHVSHKPTPKFRSPSVQTDIPSPISQVDPKIIEESSIASLSTLRVLGKKLEQIGVEISPCTPGQRNHLLCPLCNGGTSAELSLSVSITEDGNTALFKCFRAKCGWEGCIKAFADSKSTYKKMIHTPKVKKIRTIKEESLKLEPLCDELLAYFAERTISRDTLKRNAVMQRSYGDQIAIAFTYRRNGVLVNCKYRDVNKKFWQVLTTTLALGMEKIKQTIDVM